MNWITKTGLTERHSWLFHVSKYKDVLSGYIVERMTFINYSVMETCIS
jgi:hypothetical protein